MVKKLSLTTVFRLFLNTYTKATILDVGIDQQNSTKIYFSKNQLNSPESIGLPGVLGLKSDPGVRGLMVPGDGVM